MWPHATGPETEIQSGVRAIMNWQCPHAHSCGIMLPSSKNLDCPPTTSRQRYACGQRVLDMPEAALAWAAATTFARCATETPLQSQTGTRCACIHGRHISSVQARQLASSLRTSAQQLPCLQASQIDRGSLLAQTSAGWPPTFSRNGTTHPTLAWAASPSHQ